MKHSLAPKDAALILGAAPSGDPYLLPSLMAATSLGRVGGFARGRLAAP